MARQVNVTLTAWNADIVPAIRFLNLNPDADTIKIGRASKSPAKGLRGATDNAWFDSPVMSRDHAKISMDLSNSTITLQDIGSMHGTYLNNVELGKHEPVTVTNGDIVVFGVEVERGFESFPPCKFTLTYETLPIRTPSTFSFQASSDVEDEEDCDISEEDDVNIKTSNDGISPESRPIRVSEAIEPIDLTHDESPVIPSSVAEENNDSESSPEAPLITSSRPVYRNPIVLVREESASSSGYGPIFLDSDQDSDEEAIRYASDSDDGSQASSHDSNVELDYSDDESSGKSEASNKDDVSSSESDQEDQENHISGTTPEKAHEAINSNFASSSMAYPEEGADSQSANSDVALEEEQYAGSDLGLSEVGAEGIRALFDDGLLDDKSPFSEKDERVAVHESEVFHQKGTKTLTANETNEPKHVKFTDNLPEMIPSFCASQKADEFSSNNDSTAPAQSATQLFPALSVDRQPSPSDAAMVKKSIKPSCLTRQPENASSVPVHHLPGREFNKFAVQSLGDKTGKHVFFEARAGNRAKLFSRSNDKVESQTPATQSQKPLEIMGEPRSKQTDGTSLSSFKPTSSSAAKASIPMLTSFREPLDFAWPRRTFSHPASPEPDMTSAAKFNESKAALRKPSSSQPARGLRINDIIEGSSTNPTTLKRKSDRISDAVDGEVAAWEAFSAVTRSPWKPSTSLASTSGSTFKGARNDMTPTAATAASTSETRPAKKLKRFVENLGYAALGGAAVGAGVFFGLVATAPDFL